MRRVVCAFVAAAAAGGIALSAEADISISTAGPKLCYASNTWNVDNYPAKYKDFSGITWAGGNKFYLVQNNNLLSEMTITRDKNGNVNSLPTKTDRKSVV